MYAPVGAERRLALAYDADGEGLTDVFDFVPVGAGRLDLGPFTAELARTAHPVECYAIRLTAGGRSLVYTGDTGASDAVVELARGADVLLAEAAHPDAPGLPPALHLSGREAGEHAAAAQVGRLLLTHVPPWIEREAQLADARAVFPASELVEPRASYEV
jgi:ribonuclease BN (tRNA processing enzyme)